ncbi:MAG: molecular chaperone TorD family protein, partial [Gammaproteobacteria bacterium]|nr:molecular chaperone TorD family protein [Gammaproteobacteria bacterium]
GADGNGPPVSLYGGSYGGSEESRRQTMEEVARFFEYFGLKTSADDPRPPDHIATQLEFMQYLAFKEAASPSPRLGGSFHRAQEDFLSRQLVGWVDRMAADIEAQDTQPIWIWAGQITATFLKADLAHLQL